jgi:hypothetical protein
MGRSFILLKIRKRSEASIVSRSGIKADAQSGDDASGDRKDWRFIGHPAANRLIGPATAASATLAATLAHLMWILLVDMARTLVYAATQSY